MAYTKQGFHSNEKLMASQLNLMEDGIIEAQDIAQDALDNAQDARDNLQGALDKAQSALDKAQEVQNALDNAIAVERGTGENGIQQPLDTNPVNFAGRNANAIAIDPTLAAEIATGATGQYTASFNGNTMALSKRSFANGNKSVAKGEESHAEGYQCVTLGNGSHAEGTITVTVGMNSHSEGASTIARGENSHSEGTNTEAVNYSSHAEGEGTKTYGYGSHAEGVNTIARGDRSHAEGYETETGLEGDENLTGIFAHAEGARTKAQGQISHAEGIDNIATGYASHVSGLWNVANQTAQTVVGQYNDYGYSKEGFHSVFQVGAGSSEETRVNAINVSEGGEIIIRWNNEYVSLQDFMNIVANALSLQ
jgi:hypothetical protein